MGAGDENAPTKPFKASPATQEAAPMTPSYSDWSNSMQAYYGPGATPPPYYGSTVASPSPHPYMWGGQHPLIPPYGTPVPYPALYPPGGVFAHPTMAVTPSSGQTSFEGSGKASNGKGRGSGRKSKGSLGNANLVGGKVGESGNVASGSGNDGASQSDESRSDDFSDASDENQQDHLDVSKKKSFGQMLAEGANAQNGNAAANLQASVHGKPLGSQTAFTNLNIGRELWNGSAACGRPIEDERLQKREKRKQSNRESARRSRLRKQAECEDLQTRVEALSNENLTLRNEIQRLSEECETLASENNSIKEELTRIRPAEGNG